MSEIKTFRLDIKPSEAGSEAGNEGGAAMGPKRISIDNLMVSGGVGGADVGGAAPNEPNATGGVDERKNGEAVDSAAAAAAAADDGASRRAEEREGIHEDDPGRAVWLPPCCLLCLKLAGARRGLRLAITGREDEV